MANIINFIPPQKGRGQNRPDVDVLGVEKTAAQIIIFSGVRIERIEPEDGDDYNRLGPFELPSGERLIK